MRHFVLLIVLLACLGCSKGAVIGVATGLIPGVGAGVDSLVTFLVDEIDMTDAAITERTGDVDPADPR